MGKQRTITMSTPSQGVDFRQLITSRVGKDKFEDVTTEDVVNWASSQGWRDKDVERIAKGFQNFSQSSERFTFNEGEPGTFETSGTKGSGRNVGNKKGFDVGDIVGLGKNVSRLAGALEATNKPTTPKLTFNETTALAAPSSLDYKGLQLPSAEQAFSFTKGNNATGGNKTAVSTGKGKGASGQAGEQAAGQAKQQNQVSQSPLNKTVPEDNPLAPESPNNALNDPEKRKVALDRLFGDTRSPEAKKMYDSMYGAGNWAPNPDGKGILSTPSVIPDVGRLIDNTFGTDIDNSGWGGLLDLMLTPGGVKSPEALRAAGVPLWGSAKKGMVGFKDLVLPSIKKGLTRFSTSAIPAAKTATKTATKAATNVVPSAKEALQLTGKSTLQLPAGKPLLQLPPHNFVFKDVMQQSINAKAAPGLTEKVNLFKNLMTK